MEKLSENTDSVKPLLWRFPARERTKFMGRLPSWLKNKYLLTGTFFVIWMLFIDQKDILTGFESRAKLNKLQKSEQHFKQLITESQVELDLLKNNAQSIEKYAREKYMMKKDNEDLFIVKSLPENK
jgi:cell division protein DivIC